MKIIEEINMYEDNPLMYIGDLFESVVYPDSTLGWNIAGPKKVIRKISPQAIKNYRDKFYSPNKMILGLAGNYNQQQVKRSTWHNTVFASTANTMTRKRHNSLRSRRGYVPG